MRPGALEEEAGLSASELDPAVRPHYSIIVNVYLNEDSIPALLSRLAEMAGQLDGPLEVVFTVDGSPDQSLLVLADALDDQPFSSRLLAHSRNFGALAASKTGLTHASGRVFAVMAADLQEPPELYYEFFRVLDQDEADVVFGVRDNRADPARTAFAARVFWALYRRLVNHEVPPGGIDVYACNDNFRRHLVAFEEANSSLVALTLWLGFRRRTVTYDRQEREHGTSSWSFKKRVRYLSDSIFSFTDLPIRLLLGTGTIGVFVSVLLAVLVVAGRLSGAIDVPGYAATIVVIAFFAALNLCGLGILGAYVWRAFENTKGRPGAVVMLDRHFESRPKS
ncbi:glycosyltransferase [Solirubrobacter taibaiensis]|nr:glycosyltransferase [Solirubrobacter taibaiensis]